MTSAFPPLAQAVTGALGAAVANVVTYPLDLVTTRLQITDLGPPNSKKRKRFQGIHGLVTIFREIVNRDGFATLFDGLKADTIATLISNFFYFYAYSYFRSQLLRRRSRLSDNPKPPMLNATEELAVGFFSGVVSRAVSSPLSMITVRLQSGSKEEENEDEENDDEHVDGLPVRRERNWDREEKEEVKTIGSVMKDIYCNNGLLGFWTGFKTTILLCSNPAITLFIFQAYRRLFLPAKNRMNPTPLQGFIGGALSNSIAVRLLYPLMLAKTRAQAQVLLPSSQSSSDAETRRQKQNLVSILREAYRKDSLVGLYQGLEAHALKVSPRLKSPLNISADGLGGLQGFLSQGLTIMVKQRVERLILNLYLTSRTKV